MSEGAVGLLVLIAISAIAAIIAHLLMRRYSLASLLAAILSTAVFQGLAFLHVGYLDPFLPMALLAGGALAYAIALMVGLVIRSNRKAS